MEDKIVDLTGLEQWRKHVELRERFGPDLSPFMQLTKKLCKEHIRQMELEVLNEKT